MSNIIHMKVLDVQLTLDGGAVDARMLASETIDLQHEVAVICGNRALHVLLNGAYYSYDPNSGLSMLDDDGWAIDSEINPSPVHQQMLLARFREQVEVRIRHQMERKGIQSIRDWWLK